MKKLETILDKIETFCKTVQKSIYLRELILVGKTLRGRKIMENLKLSAIMTIDLIQGIRFSIGFALASVISYLSPCRSLSIGEVRKS
ncbi:MAG: hypothetical protein U9N04_01225 [Patescibacteria group bacterium]|nr:hypothetical protein [Patescibacteria group bacterium]